MKNEHVFTQSQKLDLTHTQKKFIQKRQNNRNWLNLTRVLSLDALKSEHFFSFSREKKFPTNKMQSLRLWQYNLMIQHKMELF